MILTSVNALTRISCQIADNARTVSARIRDFAIVINIGIGGGSAITDRIRRDTADAANEISAGYSSDDVVINTVRRTVRTSGERTREISDDTADVITSLYLARIGQGREGRHTIADETADVIAAAVDVAFIDGGATDCITTAPIAGNAACILVSAGDGNRLIRDIVCIGGERRICRYAPPSDICTVKTFIGAAVFMIIQGDCIICRNAERKRTSNNRAKVITGVLLYLFRTAVLDLQIIPSAAILTFRRNHPTNIDGARRFDCKCISGVRT